MVVAIIIMVLVNVIAVSCAPPPSEQDMAFAETAVKYAVNYSGSTRLAPNFWRVVDHVYGVVCYFQLGEEGMVCIEIKE